MHDVILYVHVPFCSSKCHFCSWVSPIPVPELVRAKSKFGTYAAAVIQEIRSTAARLPRQSLRPKLIYFGGGTPSLLSGEDLAGILNELHTQFPKDNSFLDTTIEMSPDTATPEKLSTLLSAGFSRISFGVQSFNDRRAKSIGRAHSPETAIKAFSMARRAGFENVNIDLMIGFPEETQEEYKANVETALMLDPDHVSIYIYKKIPGTVMAKFIDTGKLKPCPQDTAVARYVRASEALARAGYSEYMFQLFHKRNKYCFVDYHYFHLSCDYIGFGQGAHTLLGSKTYAHTQTLEQYLRRPGHNHSMKAADSETLLETKLFEMMHTEGGINYQRFSERLQISFDEAAAKSTFFRRAVEGVLATQSVRATDTGMQINDRLPRIKWLSLPPHWDDTYTPVDGNPQLVSIQAAS